MPACNAYGCSNNSGVHRNVDYYAFPDKSKNRRLYNKWVSCMKRKNFVPTKNSRVCGKHFKEDDFNESDILKIRILKDEKFRCPRLKDNAVPSKFLVGSKEIPSPKKRKSNYFKKREVLELIDNSITDSKQEREATQVCECMHVELKTDAEIQCEIGTEIYRAANSAYMNYIDEHDTSDEKVEDYVPDEITSEREEDGIENINLSEKYSFVFVCVSALLTLFSICHTCGAPVNERKVETRGVMLRIKTHCVDGHTYEWSSGSIGGSLKSNVFIASGMYLCGLTFNYLSAFSNSIKLLFFSQSYF